jgi:hypothetical protein
MVEILESSGSSKWEIDRDKLAASVLRKLGELGRGKPVDPGDVSIIHDALNLRLKEMHRLGTLWFKINPIATEMILSANSKTLTLDPSINMVYPITLHGVENDTEYKLIPFSHIGYQNIPDKDESGSPLRYRIHNNQIVCYPVPEEDFTLRLTYAAEVDESVSGTAVDIPGWAFRCLKIILAYDVADDFRVSREDKADLKSEMYEAEQKLSNMLSMSDQSEIELSVDE